MIGLYKPRDLFYSITVAACKNKWRTKYMSKGSIGQVELMMVMFGTFIWKFDSENLLNMFPIQFFPSIFLNFLAALVLKNVEDPFEKDIGF